MAKEEKETKKKVQTKKSKEEVVKKVSTETKKEETKKTINKKEVSSKKESPIIEVIFLLVVTCIISLAMGWYVCYKMQYRDSIVAKDKFLRKFVDEYQNVKENYYKNVDWRQALDNSMDGLLRSLGDNYSGVITSSDATNFNYNLEGEYEGLGIEVMQVNNKIIVTEVIKNTPASKAQIQIDDEIISINGTNLEDKKVAEFSDYVKQATGEIELIISRNGEEQNIKITKGKVTLPSVESEMIDKTNKIGYIEIGNFSVSSYKNFKKQLEKLENEGMKSLIIDLRGNNNGTVQTSYKIASLFLDSKKIIYQIDEKGTTTKFYSEGKTNKNYPIVILQNESSASGSEIFSSALKENKKAIIIGTNSFGKGTLQELYNMDNGSEYKFTTKKWLTSKGKWIEKSGVKPDIKEKASKEYLDNPTRENDNQLKKALDYLTGK